MNKVFFFFFYSLFYYHFSKFILAVIGLCCAHGLSLVVASRGYSALQSGLLTEVASYCGAQALGHGLQ